MSRQQFTLSLDTFQLKSQSYRNSLAGHIADSTLYLDSVYIKFMKCKFTKLFNSISHNTLFLEPFRQPISNFSFFIRPVTIFKTYQSGKISIFSNCENIFRLFFRDRNDRVDKRFGICLLPSKLDKRQPFTQILSLRIYCSECNGLKNLDRN